MMKSIKKAPRTLRPKIPPPGQKPKSRVFQKKVYCHRCANYINGECTALENFEVRQTYAEDLSKYLRPASVINRNNNCRWFYKDKKKK